MNSRIIEYSDYVQPNMALEGKELDANFFQHKPYLDDFNKEKGTKLVSIGTVHYEPFGIYAGKTEVPWRPEGRRYGGRAQRHHQRSPRSAAAPGIRASSS